MVAGEVIESETTLPITVDKSHIVTIGERLYTESIELIRELVNNAYDADATEVRVTLTNEAITVEDNGTGMDLDGLKQYFNIGSQEKVIHSKSPIFKRDRIGQFGIGKFSTLSACNRFEVRTQKGDFAARVVFDKKQWSESGDMWELPLEIFKPDKKRGNGTTVVLSQLNRTFDPEQVKRRILESVPVKTKNFSVFVNGVRVVTTRIPGYRIPFMEGTDYGAVHGEIVILPASQASAENMGIECRVKGVLVKRELFGIQTWGKDAARIRGEVNADFLAITSDRSGFRIDTPEYKAFEAVVGKIMREVHQQIGRLADKKETVKIRRALREALERVKKALAQNPEFAEAGAIPLGEETKGSGEPAQLMPAQKPAEIEEKDEGALSVNEKKEVTGKKVRAAVKRLTPNAVVRKIKVGDLVVSCCLDHFGEDGPECFTEGRIIFINRDHPLYKRQIRRKDSHTMHIARLLTQEISLMKTPADPRQAYERQSKLLRDAFCE